jgi:DNA polymerase-3 subunit gamma/tau
MGYQVIARKWRPQTFREVVGQQHVTRTLENALTTNRVAHAYIFSGARGVGKTTTARILAKALNCKNGPTPEPCNQCDPCKEITAGTALDVIEIDAASNRGIDQIRELRDMVQFAAIGGRHKVVILDEAHQLTSEASNALLKTLEEPPDKVIFVMATTRPEELVDTIRSRSQHFHFRALSFQEISDALRNIARQEKLQIEEAALAVIARAAEGSLRDSLSLLEQAMAYCGDKITNAAVRELLGVVSEELLDELVAAILAQSAERALALAHRLIEQGQNMQHFCREAIRHFRNLLVARTCGADSPLIAAPQDERPRLAKAAAQFSEEDLTRFFEILLATENDLRRQPDPRLHLEMGLLRLVNAARLAPLEQLMAELSGEAPRRPAGSKASAAPAGEVSASAATAASASLATSAAPPTRRSEPPRQSFAPAGAAAAPAVAPAPALVPASPPSIVAQAAGELNGLAAAQVDAIKAELQKQFRFLSSLVEPVTRWVLDGTEMQLFFTPKDRPLAEMLQAREQIEKLRRISSDVLGQPLRVCVRLESGAAAAAVEPPAQAPDAARRALRAEIEQDPVVRAMLERFGGQIRDVKRRGED